VRRAHCTLLYEHELAIKVNVSRMKQDTPFRLRVFSLKTPDFKDLTCLAYRSCNRRRSRATEPSHRKKRRRTGASHPSVSVLNMLLAISSGIVLFTTSSVSVVPNFEIRSWKRVASYITSESVGRPPLGDGVTTNSAIAAHCASVRSVASFVGLGLTRTSW
jgi:hypothetical protein